MSVLFSRSFTWLLTLLLGVGLMAPTSQAEKLNYDSKHPSFEWDNAEVAYDADSQLFTVRDEVLTLLEFADGTEIPVRDLPGTSVSLSLLVDENGAFVGGVPGDDFVLRGELDLDGDGIYELSGTLLTGEVLAFGFQLRVRNGKDEFDVSIRITGGEAAHLFSEDSHYVDMNYFWDLDDAYRGRFDQSFSGGRGDGKACIALICRNGEVEPGEECDDGNSNDNDECRNNCTEPVCGDGIVDPGEACDDGNSNDDDECRNDCSEPVCGDGIVDPGEACDDGNSNDGDECRNDCTTPDCGDGVVDPGEECDDGNRDDDDECRNDCTTPDCGDGVVDPGEECDDGNNEDGDGCSANCAAECDISVNKTCRTEARPSGNLVCEAKLAAIRLRYTGPDRSGVDVVFQGKSGATATYTNVDLVSGVTVLSQGGFSIDARPEDLGSKLSILIDGADQPIHTSCSAEVIAGQPAPLDNPKGDPSPLWLVESFVDKNGAVVALPDSTPSDNSTCMVVLSAPESCPDNKPTTLLFRYTGESCSASNNDQSGKATCSGNPGGANDVSISLDSKGSISPSDGIDVGDLVTVNSDGGKFDSQSELVISKGGNALQELGIHTSCSKPLAPGDIFGALELVGFNGGGPGALVTYDYVITNEGGSAVFGVTANDDQLGDLIDPPATIAAGDSLMISRTAMVNGDVTNTVTVNAETDGGAMCVARDEAMVVVKEGPTPPSGKKKASKKKASTSKKASSKKASTTSKKKK